MINNITIMGRLTADPERLITATGKTRTTARIAVPVNGEITEFHEVEAWEKTAEFFSANFKKGAPVVIEGAVRAKEYTTKEGERKVFHYISVKNLSFVLSQPQQQPSIAAPIQEAIDSWKEVTNIAAELGDLFEETV